MRSTRPTQGGSRPLRPSLLLLAVLASCTGEVAAPAAPSGDDAPSGPTGGSRPGGQRGSLDPGVKPASTTCGPLLAGPAAFRRLTRLEYANIVRDVLGITPVPAALAQLPPDERMGAFTTNASSPVSEAGVEGYSATAEAVASAVTPRLRELAPCSGGPADDACARGFIEGVGRRLYRRPMSATEIERLVTLHRVGAAGGFERGIQVVVEALLQSPSFLYVAERGGDRPGVTFALTGHELATRLSLFLWRSVPDAALVAAAETGKLATPDGLAAEARRLLADPRAQAMVADFHEQWLGVDRMADVTKDAAAFPAFDDALRASMQAETRAFTVHLTLAARGDVRALLTASYTLADDRLARLYGARSPGGSAPARLDLDPAQRAGVLTQESVLAAHSSPEDTGPVHRGVFLRENILCQEVPDPPSGMDITPPEPDPRLTTRQRFAEHRQSPACNGCHALIDPLGFGLESYDAIGRWRTHETGYPSTPRVRSPVSTTWPARSGEASSWPIGWPAAARCMPASRRNGGGTRSGERRTPASDAPSTR